MTRKEGENVNQKTIIFVFFPYRNGLGFYQNVIVSYYFVT